jgi:hypothetical protein
VVKESGKGLSANDLTSGLKSNYDTAYSHSQATHAPADAVTLSTVKSDTDVADAISKKHSNSLDHASGSDNQDLSGLQPKETGKGLYPDADATKLSGIEAGANNYSHPANHAASVITQDSSNRFVSDTEKGTWNGKEPGNSNIQTHVTSAHAPSDAVALATVKADTDIASAISLKHSNSLDHSNASDHSHSNKTTLDSYTQTEANLASAVSLKHSNSLDHSNASDHSHTNKTVLDSVQEALTTALKSGYDGAVTHAGSSHLQFSGLSKITVSTTEPTNPSNGDLWINSST